MAESERAVSPETHAELEPAESEASSGASMAKRRRKSILNVMRRQSKSMAASGISFEDQIATIAADLSNEEKLAKLYRISSSNAMRTLQQEDGNDDEDEEKVYDLIQNVVATLRKGPSAQNERKKTEFFRSLGERAKKLQSRSDDAPAADRALPPRVRQFRDYATKLDAESEEWRAMLMGRQERYRKARADKLAVLKGARKLTEEEDSRHLAPEVRQMLTSAPDGVAHMARLIGLEQRLDEKEKAVAGALGKSQRGVDAVKRKNDSLVERIAAVSEHLNKADISADSGLEIDTFLTDVERWMTEIKQ